MTLEEEAQQLTELLVGKVVASVTRHRDGEVLIEFSDRTRLFVDAQGNRVDCSIT
jgi:hypothetical protein